MMPQMKSKKCEATRPRVQKPPSEDAFLCYHLERTFLGISYRQFVRIKPPLSHLTLSKLPASRAVRPLRSRHDLIFGLSEETRIKADLRENS